MQIKIRNHGMPTSGEVNQQILRRIYFSLGRFSGSVRSAEVHLVDMNGPHGGVDKECRIIVSMNKGETVVVRETSTDILAAVAGAAERVGRAVARNIKFHRLGQRLNFS